jgi:type I restriction enzyme, S subunit
MIPYSAERLLPEYLFWNLRGRYFAIRDVTGQDQRRGLNMKLIGQLSLPIPPLPEQKRILAKVNDLMALCDRLEAQQCEQATQKTKLARASLTLFAEAPTPARGNHRNTSAFPPSPRRASFGAENSS